MTTTKVGNVTFTNVLKDVIILGYLVVVCDIFTTLIALPYGTEGNPVSGMILGYAGMIGIFFIKIAYMIFLYITGNEMCKAGYPHVWDKVVKIVFVLYLIIIGNNLGVYVLGIGMI